MYTLHVIKIRTSSFISILFSFLLTSSRRKQTHCFQKKAHSPLPHSFLIHLLFFTAHSFSMNSLWYQSGLSRSASSHSDYFLPSYFFFLFILFSVSVHQMDLSQNPSSAYYLHPGENPGTMLITTQLDGDNYHTWNRAIKFVNGDLPEPAQNDGLHEAWERCNVMVISWITRTLNAQIARSTVYIDNAKDLWEELRERFSKSNHFRISDLLQ